MIIKNVVERPLALELDTRVLSMEPGEEVAVSAVEVRDVVLRENLQIRTIAIVRPATLEEGEADAA
jgi:hypothetical protein